MGLPDGLTGNPVLTSTNVTLIPPVHNSVNYSFSALQMSL